MAARQTADHSTHLHGRSESAKCECCQGIEHFTLGDLQGFANSLAALSDNRRKRIIASVKSLFTFGQKVGYLRFNVAAAIKSPKAKSELAARILTEEEVMQMIYKTDKQRDQVLIRLLY